MADGFSSTLSKVADPGRSAAKRIVGKTDGSVVKFDYDHVSEWFYWPKAVADHAGMARLLGKMAERRDLMLIMGAPRAGLDLGRPQRRVWTDISASRPTLTDVERWWLPIDVDGYGVPAPWGLAAHLEDAARCVRDDALGEEFCDVRCVVTATAMSGLVGEESARLRLFFLLDRPHLIAALERWAKGAQLVGLPVDPMVVRVGQPIFTARPRFEGALLGRDPVPRALWAFELAGREERVVLDVHKHDRRAAEIAHHVARVSARCGPDWRRLLTETLGGPTSFCAPLSQALGVAARSSDSEAAIVGFASDLVAERADLGRLRQYGPVWLTRTLRRFRQRDAATRGRVAALRAGLFGKGAGDD